MAKKKKQNSIFNSHGRVNIFRMLFAATGMFILFPWYLLMFPAFSRSYVGISWVLGIIGFLTLIARNYSSHIRFLEILFLDLIILFALIAIRSYTYVYPDKSLLCWIVIFGSCAISYAIPIFNPFLAKFLRWELFAPQTKFGKVIYVSALLFMPLGGTIGTFLGMYSARQDEKFLLAIIGGGIFWSIALLVPIGTLGPVSSFEKKE